MIDGHKGKKIESARWYTIYRRFFAVVFPKRTCDGGNRLRPRTFLSRPLDRQNGLGNRTFGVDVDYRYSRMVAATVAQIRVSGGGTDVRNTVQRFREIWCMASAVDNSNSTGGASG